MKQDKSFPAVPWRVVPVCEYQKLDVHPEDLLNGGDFRKCDTYRGGGGYDQFPAIYERRFGKLVHHQFVTQLYACSLDCPYCYVTRSGVFGKWKPYTTDSLVYAFEDSKQEIFHLMGGAPALYLNHWPALMDRLPESAVFTSDFLLIERTYDPSVLNQIAGHNHALIAVDIKGVTPEDFRRNTRRTLNEPLFWKNLDALVTACVPFYLTFTAPDPNHYDEYVAKLVARYGQSIMDDAFSIGLIEYDAAPYVDILPILNQGAELVPTNL